MKILKKLLRISLLILASLTVSFCSPEDSYDTAYPASDGRIDAFTTVKKTDKGQRFGIMEKVDGKVKIILPNIYHGIFYNGRGSSFNIKAFKDGKYGVFNKRGEPIVPIQYDEIDFIGDNSTSIKVKQNGKYGLIDISSGKEGNIFLPIEYTAISGIAVNMGPYNSGSPVIATGMSDFFKIEKFGKQGIVNTSGKIIIPVEYDKIDTSDLTKNGFATIKKNNKYGAMNDKGEIIIPAEYDKVYTRSDKSFATISFAKVEKNKKYGLFSRTGELVVPVEYDMINEFKGNYAELIKDGKVGMIKKDGKIIVPAEYDDISDLSKGFLRVSKDSRYGIINENGEILLPAEYHNFTPFGKEGILKVKKGIKYGLINKQGEFILPAEYDNIDDYAINSNDKSYEKINSVKVKKGDKLGFINRKGEIVLPVEYDEFKSDHNGAFDSYVYVKKDRKWGCFNKWTAKIIAPVEYDEFNSLEGTINRKHFFLFKVKKNDKFGIMNTEGKIITPIEYDMIEDFHNRDGMANAKKGGKDFSIDNTGEAFEK